MILISSIIIGIVIIRYYAKKTAVILYENLNDITE